MICTEEQKKISSNPMAKSEIFRQVQSVVSWVSTTKNIFASNPCIYHINQVTIF